VPAQFIPFKIRDIRRGPYLHSVGVWTPTENRIHLTTCRGRSLLYLPLCFRYKKHLLDEDKASLNVGQLFLWASSCSFHSIEQIHELIHVNDYERLHLQ